MTFIVLKYAHKLTNQFVHGSVYLKAIALIEYSDLPCCLTLTKVKYHLKFLYLTLYLDDILNQNVACSQNMLCYIGCIRNSHILHCYLPTYMNVRVFQKGQDRSLVAGISDKQVRILLTSSKFPLYLVLSKHWFI